MHTVRTQEGAAGSVGASQKTQVQRDEHDAESTRGEPLNPRAGHGNALHIQSSSNHLP